MNDQSATMKREDFRLSPDELAQWGRDGYIVRHDVFTPEENDALRQVAEDIVDDKLPFPPEHIDRNALVSDGKMDRVRDLCHVNDGVD